MPTLDDLPPYRRAQLLWLCAHLGRPFVERMVQEADGRRCFMPVPPPAPPGVAVAVLGDDGRFHLVWGERMLCGEPERTGGAGHRQDCSWVESDSGPQDWTGGRDAPTEAHWGSLTVDWVVRPIGAGQDPGTVERRDRCHGGGHCWPPTPARTSTIRRLRAALIDALGPHCHLCGLYPGAMVDHDHATGLVRGLLCAFCNRTLEERPHLTGCPKAEYLRSPPAAALNLLYPASEEWRPKETTRQRKIQMLGFDPFEGLSLRTRPGTAGARRGEAVRTSTRPPPS
ncbi:hypothetical protein HY68_35730 [Streptomyces sp. AcH 505]|uniref:endonuclease domain-containing protein n=1 Tax=Streptomyces sp. AcH 505 TaxID=352211 RepID=UPI0005919CC8|nr:hypothetical protein HY68_35730 [Streptomyces sp. AcH 505]